MVEAGGVEAGGAEAGGAEAGGAEIGGAADELLVQVAGLAGVLRTAREKDEAVAWVERSALVAVMTTLCRDPRFAFEQCMDLCGVDWPERAERFDVVYNLLSVSTNRRLRVIVAVPDGEAVASMCGIWPSTTWWERETWDLFGIPFAGQPDMRRILTDYGFEGHPLRKDFPLTGYVQVRYDEERHAVVQEKVALVQDFRNFDFLSPWEAMTELPGDEKARAGRQPEGGEGGK